MSRFESTDRYDALGIPQPNPATMCKGQCEGTGFVPLHKDDHDPEFAGLWAAAEEEKPTDTGWHFVVCPRCKGTQMEPGQ